MKSAYLFTYSIRWNTLQCIQNFYSYKQKEFRARKLNGKSQNKKGILNKVPENVKDFKYVAYINILYK